jgi:hypothetical protein
LAEAGSNSISHGFRTVETYRRAHPPPAESVRDEDESVVHH